MGPLSTSRVRFSTLTQKASVVFLVVGILACSGGGGYSGGGGTTYPPTIATQPTNQTTTVGRPATFTVVATGAGSYQWQAGSTDIAGATNASYAVLSATGAQNGATYRAIATNAGGSVTSNAASLTVNPVLSFSTQPVSITVAIPSSATFSAAVSGGTAPLSYQWQRNGTAIPSATSANYTLSVSSSADNAAIFTLGVTDAVGATAASAAATLTVTSGTAPAITQEPVNQTTTVGRPASFTVAATGATGYQWQTGTTDIPGATTSTYTVQAASSGQNGATFRALATNAAGSSASHSATLTVNPLPTFTVQPAAYTAVIPASATFTSSASGGTPPLSFQWLRNGSPIPSATLASYTLPVTASADNGVAFSLRVTDSVGAIATSAAATLSAVTLPATFHATVLRRPMVPIAAANTGQALSERTQLEAEGLSLSSDGGLLVWPEMPAAGWRVDLGSQHTLLGVDGTFTLSSPTDAAQFATLTHPSDSRRSTQVSLAQLASVVGSATRIVIPEPYRGPCGMSFGDDLNCSLPGLPPPPIQTFFMAGDWRIPTPSPQGCASCPQNVESRADTAPLTSPNLVCAPPLLSNNAARQVVYTSSPDGIRGSYKDPAISASKTQNCVINDGYTTNPSVPKDIRYFGSTCNRYVQSGACPNENSFSDAEYVVLTVANPIKTLINFLTGADTWVPAPITSGLIIHCVQNHKLRNCAMVCIGDVSCDFTVDHHIARAGESYTTYIPSGGVSEPFVVHNNGIYGITQIVKVKDDIGGVLLGGGVLFVGVDQEIHHYRPTNYVAVDTNSGDPTSYVTDESVTYTPPSSAPVGAQAIYKFMVDDQQVTVTFIISL